MENQFSYPLIPTHFLGWSSAQNVTWYKKLWMKKSQNMLVWLSEMVLAQHLFCTVCLLRRLVEGIRKPDTCHNDWSRWFAISSLYIWVFFSGLLLLHLVADFLFLCLRVRVSVYCNLTHGGWKEVFSRKNVIEWVSEWVGEFNPCLSISDVSDSTMAEEFLLFVCMWWSISRIEYI